MHSTGGGTRWGGADGNQNNQDARRGAYLERVAGGTAAARAARAEEELEQEERVEEESDELQKQRGRELIPRSVELAGRRVRRVEQEFARAEERERTVRGIQVEGCMTGAVECGGLCFVERNARANSEIQTDWSDNCGSICARRPWPSYYKETLQLARYIDLITINICLMWS